MKGFSIGKSTCCLFSVQDSPTESLACYYLFHAHAENKTQFLYAKQQCFQMGKFQLLLLKSVETIQ